MKILADNEGVVTIIEQDDGNKKITVEPTGDAFISIRACETAYPIDLIDLIFRTKGAGYLCDEICRDVDAGYGSAIWSRI